MVLFIQRALSTYYHVFRVSNGRMIRISTYIDFTLQLNSGWIIGLEIDVLKHIRQSNVAQSTSKRTPAEAFVYIDCWILDALLLYGGLPLSNSDTVKWALVRKPTNLYIQRHSEVRFCYFFLCFQVEYIFCYHICHSLAVCMCSTVANLYANWRSALVWNINVLIAQMIFKWKSSCDFFRLCPVVF